MSDPYVALAAGVVGLFIGSFLNVAAWRLPRGESVVTPSRSHCTSCGNEIAWYDNLPIVSWLLLRGKCRNCGEPISTLYPVTELATGVLFAAVGAHRGWSWGLVPDLVLAATAVVVTRTDLSHRIVPNKVVIVAALLALPLQAFGRSDELIEFVIAGAGAFTFMLLAALAYPAGMGMGDVKLAGVMGLYLGSAVIPALGISFLLGTIAGGVILARFGVAAGRKKGVPFAPFMAVGAVLAIFIGDGLIDWYLDTFLST